MMRFDQFNRRELVALLGASALWPAGTARAQKGKTFRLAALSPASAQLDTIRTLVLPELAKAGIAEGEQSRFLRALRRQGEAA